MKIVGGHYREIVRFPHFNENWGSGLRAAAAISQHSDDTELHTYCAEEEVEQLAALCAAFRIGHHHSQRPQPIIFDYFHGASIPLVYPAEITLPKMPPIEIEGEIILRFGLIEGEAKVNGGRVVYDPQSGLTPQFFHHNGSAAKELAWVLNRKELSGLTKREDIHNAARELLETPNTAAVVVKCGAWGAKLYTKTGITHIPAFICSTVFPIGSGDVFSAFFAWLWGQQHQKLEDAALLASKATAFYCANAFLPVPKNYASSVDRDHKPFIEDSTIPKKIYLAGPFFTIAQQWLIEEARIALESAGLKVFSPLHDVGFGEPSEVATKDLDALKSSQCVFAILDGYDAGTLFEVGCARTINLPVIAYCTNPNAAQLTMVLGTGCDVFSDFTTAIYHAVWKVFAK